MTNNWHVEGVTECDEMQPSGARIQGMKYQNPIQHIQFQYFEAPNEASNNLGDERRYATPDQAGTWEARRNSASMEDQECQSKLKPLSKSLPEIQSQVTSQSLPFNFLRFIHPYHPVYRILYAIFDRLALFYCSKQQPAHIKSITLFSSQTNKNIVSICRFGPR